MKKIIFVAMLIIVSFATGFAQSKAPSAVLNTFKQKFPTATNVSWGKEYKTEWEAEFTLDGKKISANFTNNGDWLETETEIPVTQLPKAVTDAIQKQYPAWKITEASKTETSKNGTIYEADLKSGKLKKEVSYKEDGTSVK